MQDDTCARAFPLTSMNQGLEGDQPISHAATVTAVLRFFYPKLNEYLASSTEWIGTNRVY